MEEAFVKFWKHGAWKGRPFHDFAKTLRGFTWKISVARDAEGYLEWGLEVRLGRPVSEECEALMARWATWVQGKDGTYCRPCLYLRLSEAFCEVPWPSTPLEVGDRHEEGAEATNGLVHQSVLVAPKEGPCPGNPHEWV